MRLNALLTRRLRGLSFTDRESFAAAAATSAGPLPLLAVEEEHRIHQFLESAVIDERPLDWK